MATVYRIAAAMFLALLAACGGGGTSETVIEQFTDTAADYTITGDGDYTPGPIALQRTEAKAGTYRYELTAELRTVDRAAADTASVRLLPAGAGPCEGGQAAYAVLAKGQSVTVSVDMRCERTGAGPWQMDAVIDLMQGKSTVQVVGMTLRTALVE